MKPRLLIVDDEPDMLDFLERAFRHKYQVARAASAREALEHLAAGTFAVLVTDQKMPHMTGVELLDAIAGQHPNMVRVLLSGFTDVPEIQRAIQRCEIDNYVVKPVDSESLHAAVDAAIESKQTSPRRTS